MIASKKRIVMFSSRGVIEIKLEVGNRKLDQGNANLTMVCGRAEMTMGPLTVKHSQKMDLVRFKSS